MRKTKEIKKDCFAYSKVNKGFYCKAIYSMSCEKCPFYQNKEDYLLRGGEVE